MIGILISMKYIEKKNWMQSLVVWVTVMLSITIFASLYWYYLPLSNDLYVAYIAMFKFGIYIGSFFLITKYWLRISIQRSIPTLFVAIVIDIIIGSLLAIYILNTGMINDWINWFPHISLI